MYDPLMEVRTTLTSTVHTVGGDGASRSNIGGNEIQKIIDRVIADVINRSVDFKPLVARKSLDQRAYIWNVRTDLGSTSKAAVYSEGSYSTPYPSTKKQLFAPVISYRADYEVSGLMVETSSSYYDAIADESKDALAELDIFEEKMMICGSDTNAYGVTSGFNGLLQLMNWYQTNGGDTEGTAANKMGDTTAVYGWTRGTTSAAASAFTDVSYVIAGTVGSATGVLELNHLDKALDLSDKHGGKGHKRIFFCSISRGSEISQLLQPQQRFAGTLNLEGGMTISLYKGIPIITSRYMDKNGATNTTSWNSSTDADNSMYLLDMDQIEMRIVNGVDSRHVAVIGEASGTAGYNRADVVGGYFKTYGIFVMRTFNTQVHICNLTAP